MLFVCIHGGQTTQQYSPSKLQTLENHVGFSHPRGQWGCSRWVPLTSWHGLTPLRRRDINGNRQPISAFLREWVCLPADRVSVSPISSCKEEGARNARPKYPHQRDECPLRTIKWHIQRWGWGVRHGPPHWQMNQAWLYVYSCQLGLQFRHSILEKCTQQRL